MTDTSLICDSNTVISSLPFDVAIEILLSLEVLDICALGSCSRLWKEICASDYIWQSLAKQRWPSLPSSSSSSSMGWRDVYVSFHHEMANKAKDVVQYVELCKDSIEVEDYHKAVQDLNSMQMSFKDVQIFLFKPKVNVLLNLIGLHYCMFNLIVPAEHVKDALVSCKISEREVCVKWWRIARWFFGFHMREEPHCCNINLSDLTKEKGELILGILNRGAIHEVLHVQISILNATITPGSSESS